MLTLKEQNYLTELDRIEGLSIREIMRRTGWHYKTVVKYLNMEDWNSGYKPRKQQGSLLEPLYPLIDEWLLEDMKRPRKYRRTATKIFNDIAKSEEHSKLLKVGKQTVLNYVNKRKKELYKKTYKTAMFALHSMGEAQVDFGDIIVKMPNGSEEIWHELVVSFPWSNAGFMQVCRFETKECLCEGLIRIFEYIGGVPIRILFDNMSSAVVHIEKHGERTLTDMFMRFTMHHRFKAEFCNPDSPHEKGNVENKVGYLRRNYLLPPPEITDLAAFNADLLDICMADLEREHYTIGEQISDLFAQEQAAFIPLPREPFRVFSIEKIKTDKYSFFKFDTNRYSTSPEYTKCEMWLEIGAEELRVLNEKYEHIVTHVRRFGRETQPVIVFENYVSALCRKPRAFLSSPFFPTLPQNIQDHLKACNYADLKKMLLTLLPIIKDDKLGDAEAVLDLLKIKTADEFSAAYRALTEDTRPLPTVTTATTPTQIPYLPKLDEYRALMDKIGGDEQ